MASATTPIPCALPAARRGVTIAASRCDLDTEAVDLLIIDLANGVRSETVFRTLTRRDPACFGRPYEDLNEGALLTLEACELLLYFSLAYAPQRGDRSECLRPWLCFARLPSVD